MARLNLARKIAAITLIVWSSTYTITMLAAFFGSRCNRKRARYLGKPLAMAGLGHSQHLSRRKPLS